MGLRINCLIKDTELAQSLRDAVKFFAFEMRGNDEKASVRKVYDQIRKAGIEVDLESVGHAYLDIAPSDDPLFDSTNEVYDTVGENERTAIENMTFSTTTGVEKIGELSAEKGAVRAIQNFFTSSLKTNAKVKSLQKTFEQALLGYMQKVTGKIEKTPQTPEQWQTTINKALALETTSIRDVNGVARGIRNLYDGMQDYLEEVSRKIGDEVTPEVRDLWEAHIKDLQASTYRLMFNSRDGKAALDQIMQEAGYSKKFGDTTVLDWKKLAGTINDVSLLKDNVIRVMERNGYDSETAERIADSFQVEYQSLQKDVAAKATKELNKRLQQIENPKVAEASSDYERLANLAALGVFNNAYDKVVYKTMGVGDLEQSSINALKEVTAQFVQLSKEVDNKNIFATAPFRALGEQVNSIIAESAHDKTKMTKFVKWYGSFVDIQNIGRLMGFATMAENVTSGALAVMESALRARKVGGDMGQDLYHSTQTWMDVMTTGQTYGKEHFKFGVSGDIMESMRLGLNTDSPKEFGKSVLSSTGYLATSLFRATQSGGDSFFKSYKTQKLFLLNIHEALVGKAGMTPDDASKFINENLYGQSFENAKAQAKDILIKTGFEPTEPMIAKFANDLVKQNLTTSGALDVDTVEAAFNSAYKVAGIGLGHETTWAIAEGLKGARAAGKEKEQRYLREGKYNKYASRKLMNTILYHQVMPFAVGGANWVKLRIEKNLGVGIVTGALDKARTKAINFTDRKAMEKDFTEKQAAKDRIARGVIGLIETAAFTAAYLGIKSQLTGTNKEKDDKITQSIKNNLILNKLFNKVATDPALMYYYWNEDPNLSKASLDYFVATTNFGGDYDMRVQVNKMMEDAARGKTDDANARLGNIIGSKYEVPLWRAYKQYGRAGYQLLHWNEKLPSDWQKPTSFAEGFSGGNMLEDIGVFQRNSSLLSLPGVGDKAYKQFQEMGLEKMRDVKGDWWNTKNQNGNYIIRSSKEREQAKNAYQQWIKIHK